MIADPYRVLGVSENAADADLRKAYRDLSKKYHPDANPDNPQAAEEKFKEVQEAYRQIVDARARGTSAYGNNGSPYGQSSYGQSAYGRSGDSRGGSYYDSREAGGQDGFYDFFNQWQRYSEQQRTSRPEESSTVLQAARNYIQAGHYQEALTALGGVTEASRNARWYDYFAIANSCQGNNVAALEAAKRADDMEPNSQEYRQLLAQLQNGRQAYQQRGAAYSGGAPGSTFCLSLCLINACFGGCGYPMFCCL